MVKIEAYVRPSSAIEFHQAMTEAGVSGVTMWETKGTGRDLDEDLGKKMFRGSEIKSQFISRVRIETIVEDNTKPAVIEALKELAKTKDLGKLKIFVSPISESFSL